MEGGGMEGNEERILVFVRLRPLNDEEIFCGDVSDWECVSDDTIVCKNESTHHAAAYHTFDRVFGSDSSTREVYEKAVKDVALSVLDGMNSTIFAYGQTRSGKTYTMNGIAEYAVADIYDAIRNRSGRKFVLKLSAMEISRESVMDLLNSDTPLDDPESLTEEILTDKRHASKLLSRLRVQKQKREISLNGMSSGSHHITRLRIESSPLEFSNEEMLSASLSLVDLAGTGDDDADTEPESCNGLLALLSKERNSRSIPYRDSILTRILKPSVEGNSRMGIIFTMSPARSCTEQSRNTLHFARKASSNPRVNVVISRDLEEEVARLETELRSSEFHTAAMLKEKDAQIEKLQEEIKDLMLQRDIAQSQLKECLEMLGGGDIGQSLMQSDFRCYPRFRVKRFLDSDSQEQEGSSSEHSRSSSTEHFAKVGYGDELLNSNPGGVRVLISSVHSSEFNSTFTTSDPEIEKPGSWTSEKEEIIAGEASGPDYSLVEETTVERLDSLKMTESEGLEKNHGDCREVNISPAEASTSGSVKVEEEATEYSKKNLKDGVLGPIKDELRSLTSWPVEFRRLQREIIQLWDICNVSLARRTYFFMLFQGDDPADAIDMALEIRRMKFLKDKFSAGEKVVVNGKRITHSSSGKALGQERRMLCNQMAKKLSEKEREALFVEWGIDIVSKMRRLKLAHLVWSKTDDMQHVAASAGLVAKLLGYMDQGKVPTREMFGGLLHFSPKSSSTIGVCSFKSSLRSIL